jgi:N-acetylmuramic acid 6-phosphate etherase
MDLVLNNLLTEERNPASMDIDRHTTEHILRIINQEDQKVPLAVAKEIPQITEAVDLVTKALKNGGRLIYVGAGSSGRLGVLDASECPPTFSVSPELVQGVIAGGVEALYKSVETSEDNQKAGAAAMKSRQLSYLDVVAGIAASGRTPFTVGAMRYGKTIGAKVISITCNPDSKMAEIADISIAPVVGPEVITGSTRMKSATAQKLVLNMITTSTMIKLGYVYSNLMINVRMENTKLRERGRRIIMSATGVDYEAADQALKRAKGDVKVAIVMLQCGESHKVALQRLKRLNMNLRAALEGHELTMNRTVK